MKKHLLIVTLVFFSVIAKADNKIYFQGYMFHNSSTHTIQVQYWLCNPPTGNPNFDIASISLTLEWNASVVSFVNSSFYPSGSYLDASDYLEASGPDANTTLSTITHGGLTYHRTKYLRSTNLCSNLVHLGNNSCIPFFQATFSISPAIENNYDYLNTAASNYIAGFNGFGPLTAPIQFSTGAQLDDAGSSNSCNGTVGSTTSIQSSNSTNPTFNSSSAPLPVKWLSFDVLKQNNRAQLIWQTSTELNNLGFEIQRKVDDRFEKIGFVSSKTSDGTSISNLSYDFSDANLPANKTSYYRIKQIGYDKSESYSEVKSVMFNSKNFQVLIYPNPSHGIVNVVIPDDNGVIDINLVDFSGRIIKQWSSYKVQNLQLRDLKTGIYSLQISNRDTGEKVSQKIIVQ